MIRIIPSGGGPLVELSWAFDTIESKISPRAFYDMNKTSK
jgi:hypothetical protein